MTLKKFAKKLQIGIQVKGEMHSPQPRMYYWHCWLGDERTIVTMDPDDSEVRAQGSGVTLIESLEGLTHNIRGKTIYIIRKNKQQEKIQIPGNLRA